MTGDNVQSRSIVLGINYGLHDSSAALVVDGRVVAAAEEERFSRVKHTTAFPENAIKYVVAEAGYELADITDVAYYWNTQGRYGERLVFHAGQCLRRLFRPVALMRYLKGFASMRATPDASSMLVPGKTIDATFDGALQDYKLHTLDHHLCHAACAYYPTEYEDAAILIVDGGGEMESTTLYKGDGAQITQLERQPLPHSIGFLYGAATEYLGFMRNHDEYKVMGMAAYGKPTDIDAIRKIASYKGGIQFRLDDRYFDQIYGGEHWYSSKFPEAFGPVRDPAEPITDRHFDFAASVQLRVEEMLVDIARYALQKTGSCNLCMAGGVALNCLANQKITDTLRAEGLLDNYYAHPASSDAGASLGAALALYQQQTGKRPPPEVSPYLGPGYDNNEILQVLEATEGINFEKQEDIATALASELYEGNVACRFVGRMEWGPRALGNRSIIASPANAAIREEVNVKVKLREEFRPFAPACLDTDFDTYFEGEKNPYMLMVNQAKEGAVDVVPAVVHFDGTARVQYVTRAMNQEFYALLEAFKKLSGFGVLLNTSFNIQEPVVCTPQHAVNTFMNSSMDCLALGDYLVRRTP